MKLGTKEFYDIMENFEKTYNHMRLDKESKDNWRNGQIYQNGETNNAFKIFHMGYSLGRSIYMN